MARISLSSVSLCRLFPIAVVALSTLALTQGQILPPQAWPQQHTHTEIMYTPGLDTIQNKPVWYDFPNLRYRADLHLISGLYFSNFSSYWLGNDLYMYTWDIDSCVHLDMGFGMMRPDWFLTNATLWDTGFWLSHKSDALDTNFHYTGWTYKSAGEAGIFNYYSLNTTGEPFSMFAPSPTGPVVNEYYDFNTWDPSNTTVFDLPATPACINGSSLLSTNTLEEKIQFIRNKIGMSLPEIYMAL